MRVGIVETEKQIDPVEERDRAKEALTELFNEAKVQKTHIIVERTIATSKQHSMMLLLAVADGGSTAGQLTTLSASHSFNLRHYRAKQRSVTVRSPPLADLVASSLAA